jgi:carbamoyl-phosphate synthase large subunit
MCSTREVIGMEYDFSGAFAKAQIAVGQKLPVNDTIFLGLSDLTKLHLAEMGCKFHELGLNIMLLHLEWRKYFS